MMGGNAKLCPAFKAARRICSKEIFLAVSGWKEESSLLTFTGGGRMILPGVLEACHQFDDICGGALPADHD